MLTDLSRLRIFRWPHEDDPKKRLMLDLSRKTSRTASC
jgi:hypothetical protein